MDKNNDYAPSQLQTQLIQHRPMEQSSRKNNFLVDSGQFMGRLKSFFFKLEGASIQYQHRQCTP